MGLKETRYRDYLITYRPKPVPSRSFDWDFVHDAYDGPGDHRCGFEESEEACRESIDQLYEEEEPC